MNGSSIHNLFNDLWSDLENISLWWQIGTVATGIVLGWGLTRLLGKTVGVKKGPLVVQLGMESFMRVLSPLLAFALIAAAKPVLAKWHHVNLLRIAMPLLASFALIRLAFYLVRRVFTRGRTAGSLLLLFEKVFALLVWIGVALYITGLWHEILLPLEEAVIPIGVHKVSLLAIIQALVSVVVTLILALWAGTFLEDRLMQISEMHSSMRVVLARMGRACLILVAILVSLSMVGIDLTVLSVFGGALGVGLGLGLQKIASNYVSGFVILLERSLTIGDMIAVDKYYGKVTRINTRYTILQGLDGIESVVPNEMFVSNSVQNYSLTNRTLRLATQVAVEYGTDVDFVLRLLEEAAGGIARVLKDPAPQAMLVRFGADGLELEVGFWINDPENGRAGVQSDVNRAIWKALQQHQINIPYPQREIRLVNSDTKPSTHGEIDNCRRI